MARLYSRTISRLLYRRRRRIIRYDTVLSFRDPFGNRSRRRCLPSRRCGINSPTLIGVSALLFFFAVSTVSAAPNSEQFITIERQVREIVANPGQQISDEVLLKNQSSRPVKVSVTVQDLAIRKDGSRELAFSAAGKEQRGAGEWIHLAEDKLLILPNTERSFRFKVKVPKSAVAGSFHAAFLLSLSDDKPSGNVAISSEQSVVMLLHVKGKTKRRLEVGVVPKSKFLWSGGRKYWIVTISNKGDTYESFGGVLHLKSLLGKDENIAIQPGILLPKEARKQRIYSNLRSAPNRFVVDVSVRSKGHNAGNRGATDMNISSNRSTSYLIPLWLIAVFLFSGGILINEWFKRRRIKKFDD